MEVGAQRDSGRSHGHGYARNGAIFQVQIEGGKCNQTGLQIDITGTNGDLQVTNERSFVTKHHDLIRGAQGERSSWSDLCTPDRFCVIPHSDLDVSVQDLAQLYATFARDRSNVGKTTRDFSDALAMHRLIDAIYQASSSRTSVQLKEQS